MDRILGCGPKDCRFDSCRAHMDPLSHALIGKILSAKKNSKKDIFWVILFSIIADLPSIPLYFYLGYLNNRFLWIADNSDWNGFRGPHPFLNMLSDIPHSIFFAFLIILPLILYFKLPKMAFFAYLLHILIDLLTHKGEWAIKIFYPLNYTINGFTNAWAWPLLFLIISWLILLSLAIIFRYYLKRKDALPINPN